MDADMRARLAERDKQLAQLRRRDTKNYYLGEIAGAKDKGKKVAWTPAGLITPLLNAMDIVACPPEQYSAICAGKQQALGFCTAAEAQGIPPGLCSYGRCIMGMMFEHDGPFGAMPDPDIVVSDVGVCDAHAKMWEVPAQYFGIPHFHLDGTFSFDGRLSPAAVDYRVSELHRLVHFCEEHLGAKFDYDRFRENMLIEAKMRGLLTEMQILRKERPCPRSTRDTLGDMFYVAAMPDRQEAVDYFTLVVEDCRERVQHGIGVVDNERFRLYYDNIPIWFWLQFYEYFLAQGAVFVCDNYTNTMLNSYHFQGGEFDPDRPFESLAWRQMATQSCTGVEPTLDWYTRYVEEWHIDGAVFLVNRSCKAATNGRRDKVRMIRSQYGIPVLEFEGEMADPLSIDKDDVLDRAKMFLERLEARAAEQQRTLIDQQVPR